MKKTEEAKALTEKNLIEANNTLKKENAQLLAKLSALLNHNQEINARNQDLQNEYFNHLTVLSTKNI